jgi:tripartite-type tricarboxylate transporter receptor subunit TctC
LPAFEAEQWIGMLAPSRTPAVLIARLNREIVEILQTPTMEAALVAQGAILAPGTPEEFSAFIKHETEKLKRLIQVAGIRAD